MTYDEAVTVACKARDEKKTNVYVYAFINQDEAADFVVSLMKVRGLRRPVYVARKDCLNA